MLVFCFYFHVLPHTALEKGFYHQKTWSNVSFTDNFSSLYGAKGCYVWVCSLKKKKVKLHVWNSFTACQSEVHTHSLLCNPAAASCFVESEDETLLRQKLTLFFAGCPLVSCSLRGLHSARCFHRAAQRLTTLWRCCDLCRTQAEKWGTEILGLEITRNAQ